MATEEKEPSKLTSMRLSPEMLQRLDYYRDRYGWTPGETLAQLLDYRDRIQNAVELLGHGVLNDGSPVVFSRHSLTGAVHFLKDDEATAFFAWIVGELGEPVPDAFRDMSGYPEREFD